MKYVDWWIIVLVIVVAVVVVALQGFVMKRWCSTRVEYQYRKLEVLFTPSERYVFRCLSQQAVGENFINYNVGSSGE